MHSVSGWGGSKRAEPIMFLPAGESECLGRWPLGCGSCVLQESSHKLLVEKQKPGCLLPQYLSFRLIAALASVFTPVFRMHFYVFLLFLNKGTSLPVFLNLKMRKLNKPTL